MANNKPLDPLAERKLQAQKAMEDDKHRVAKEVKINQRNKRRTEAERAMEGDELRKRRELREQLALRQAKEREAITQDRQAIGEAEVQTIEAAETKASEEAEAAETVYQKRVDKIETSNQTIEQLKGQKVMMSPIRTFKSDLTRVVKEGGVSLSTIAISEQERKRFGLGPAAEEIKPSNKNALLPYLLLILTIVVIGGTVFLWWQSKQMIALPSVTNNTPSQNLFIFADATRKLELSSTVANIRAAINQEAKNTEGEWTIKDIAFTQGGVAMPWQRVAQALELKIPDVLMRSLNSQYMFGLYRTGSINQRFILLKTSSPDTAFASLVTWEGAMASQLLPLLHETSPKLSLSNTAFKDKLVRNKDARILVTAEKQTVLFYALLDRQTIILAPNEETFIAVFDRFTSNQ
jgi:hypothetical protein